MGASLAPQSQQQTALGRTDARAEVRTLGGVRLHPHVPRPTTGLRATWTSSRNLCVLQNLPDGPQGGALPLQTFEGVRLQGMGAGSGAPCKGLGKT